MRIKRIQVEEGFLEGLDVEFSEGLNTIIGARGTGKTSVLELIRYCLAAPSFTSEASKRSADHALAILGGGQVTVTLGGSGGDILVTRASGAETFRASGPFEAPLIMSQTEVESVGLHSAGRLRLVDSFIVDKKSLFQKEGILIGEIKSLVSQLESLLREKNDLDERLSGLKKIDEALLALGEKEKAIASFSEVASKQKIQLDEISGLSSKLAVAGTYLERYKGSVTEGLVSLHKGLVSLYSREVWQGEGESPVADIELRLNAGYLKLAEGYQQVRDLLDVLDKNYQEKQSAKVALEDRARELRREIEQVVQGAGSVAREGAQLRENREQLLSLISLQNAHSTKISEIKGRVSAGLDSLDELRNQRFELRRAVCERINSRLYPKIKIEIERASEVVEYYRVLSESLKGSGLRYVEIAKSISQLLSPRELMEAVESNNYDYLAEMAGIAKDRAAKTILHLKEVGVGDVCTCLVDDQVSFFLLDGTEFKDLSQLSTGQRCTVVLPIILEHQDRVLIVDQPEDHIDNAFIAETLIKAIRGRSSSSQLIFTTHNANIPVLGEADRVIHMASDGRRGYVLIADDLENTKTVSAISNVMEGGTEAFEYRANFYHKVTVDAS